MYFVTAIDVCVRCKIRIEMTKERALVLKGQEERLGAMITALQMEKAREVGAEMGCTYNAESQTCL